MVNKHNEFAKSLRNIMNHEENKRERSDLKIYGENSDMDRYSLQEILVKKFTELFGPIDDDDEL